MASSSGVSRKSDFTYQFTSGGALVLREPLDDFHRGEIRSNLQRGLFQFVDPPGEGVGLIEVLESEFAPSPLYRPGQQEPSRSHQGGEMRNVAHLAEDSRNHDAEPLVADVLELLQRHEGGLDFYAEDLQGLEAVVERRREQTRTFFDSIKDPGQLQYHCLNGSVYRKIALDLLPERAEQALDMGTGAGLLLPELLKKMERVIAVDSSTTMLDMARKTAGKDAVRCEFRLGDLGHLPVADGEVDLVSPVDGHGRDAECLSDLGEVGVV